VIPEYFGGVLTVNGKAWPAIDAKRAIYRFTIVNACNSRFLVLQLVNAESTAIRDQVPKLQVLMTDHGFLERPTLRDHLVVAPLERYTV